MPSINSNFIPYCFPNGYYIEQYFLISEHMGLQKKTKNYELGALEKTTINEYLPFCIVHLILFIHLNVNTNVLLLMVTCLVENNRVLSIDE